MNPQNLFIHSLLIIIIELLKILISKTSRSAFTHLSVPRTCYVCTRGCKQGWHRAVVCQDALEDIFSHGGLVGCWKTDSNATSAMHSWGWDLAWPKC